MRGLSLLLVVSLLAGCATRQQAATTTLVVGTTALVLGGAIVYKGETCETYYPDQCTVADLAESHVGLPLLGLGLVLTGIGVLTRADASQP